MATKKYCDFCENEITDDDKTVFAVIVEEYDDGVYLSRREYDMCEDCHNGFVEWKDERKNVNK